MPLDSEKISIENARRSLVLARDITRRSDKFREFNMQRPELN